MVPSKASLTRSPRNTKCEQSEPPGTADCYGPKAGFNEIQYTHHEGLPRNLNKGREAVAPPRRWGHDFSVRS